LDVSGYFGVGGNHTLIANVTPPEGGCVRRWLDGPNRWDPRDATALGALMNTRGLMELIVLNIGLDLRVISPELFAMMVMMAIVTTMLTSPIVRALVRPEPQPD